MFIDLRDIRTEMNNNFLFNVYILVCFNDKSFRVFYFTALSKIHFSLLFVDDRVNTLVITPSLKITSNF